MSKKNKRGYRLHRDRVLFSGGEIVRTIKYPLIAVASKESAQNLQNLERAIIDSDLKIRGPVNLNDYTDFLKRGAKPYTLIDFWVDSLKAGVVWQPSIAKLINFFRPEFYLQIMQSADPRIHKYFEITKFVENTILQSNMRSTSTKNSKTKLFTSCLKQEYINDLEAQNLVLEIIDNFFDEDGSFRKDVDQTQVWENKYGIRKPKLRETQKTGEAEDAGDITFTIVPELIDFNTEDIEVMVRKRQEWLMRSNMNDTSALESVLGISENANALSNYLNKVYRLLLDFGLDELINQLKGLGLVEANKERQIREALEYLSDKAKVLGVPALKELVGIETSNWADYRQNISGKLNSWLSNYLERKTKRGDELRKLHDALCSLPQDLKPGYDGTLFSTEEVQDETYNSIIDLSKDLLELLDEEENYGDEKYFSVKTENLPLFESILSELKRKLNIYYQKQMQREDSDETSDKRFPHIFAKIKAPMSFYGEVKYRVNENLITDTIKGLEDGIDAVKDLIDKLRHDFNPDLSKDGINEDALRRLDFAWRKYSTGSVSSEHFSRFFVDFLTKYTADDFQFVFKDADKNNRYNKYRYFISPYQKGALTAIRTRYNAPAELVERFVSESLQALLSFDKREVIKDKKLLLDWIELAKSVVSTLVTYNKDMFNIKEYKMVTYHNIPEYCKVFEVENVNIDRFKYIVNSYLFSALKGYANVYSKERYIAKYTMQIIKSDEKFPVYVAKKDLTSLGPTWDKGFCDLLADHRYFVALKKSTNNKKDAGTINALRISKSGPQPTVLKQEELGDYAVINSSYYQIQFLDRLLYKPHVWTDLDVKINEPSFVLERDYNINWDLETKRPTFTLRENSKYNKLYLALPFTISAKTSKQDAPLYSIKERPLSYPVLGVDVGEYGLAYVLCQLTKEKADILDYGFIYSSEIANIHDKFSLIQQRARTGLFNQKLNVVERVRANAIGSLRNQIHLYVVDSVATPIYEYSIKNFETGSGKVTKIYNSVKRADTEFESEADKSIHSHIWGRGTKYVGKALSSYGSSYTCVNCQKSVYEIERDNNFGHDFEVLESNRDPIFKLGCGSLVFSIYAKDGIDERHIEIMNKKQIDQLLKKAKDYARPPVESAVLANVLPEYYQLKPKLQDFKNKRGNSAIFVCPFCNYITDADIQAAFVMAVRGYINLSNGGKKENLKTINYFEDTINYLKNINNKQEVAQKLRFNV